MVPPPPTAHTSVAELAHSESIGPPWGAGRCQPQPPTLPPPPGAGASGKPHSFGVPAPPQLDGARQAPHESIPPHPSATIPHDAPTAPHVVGVHPHRFAVPPPPHVCGGVH